MPYVTFARGTLPGFGHAWPSKQEAVDNRPHDCEVGFDPTPDESAAWRAREASRFVDLIGAEHTYTAVPWAERLQQIVGLLPPTRLDTASDARSDAGLFETYTPDQVDGARRMLDHFAHMSTSHPGMVVYTPNETSGHEDRQLRVTAGRYLQQYTLGVLDDTEALADSVRAATSTGVQFARTAREIGWVYASANRHFDSCMDGRDDDHFPDPSCHPARVYAGPDLAVAYIGTLHPTDPQENDLRARAVVWPAKKRYSRIFGDHRMLAAGLQALGYTQPSAPLAGARIRKIDDGDGYVMPYVDWHESADVDDDNDCLILRADTDGEVGTQTTSGTSDDSGANYCERCNERCGRNQSYCHECNESMFSCERCDGQYSENDVDRHGHDYGTLCDDCHDETDHECAHCGEYFNEYDLNRNERARARDNGFELCSDCDGHVHRCDACGTYADDDDLTDGTCAECIAEAEATARREAEAEKLARRLFPKRRRPRGTLPTSTTPDTSSTAGGAL